MGVLSGTQEKVQAPGFIHSQKKYYKLFSVITYVQVKTPENNSVYIFKKMLIQILEHVNSQCLE